MKVVVTGPDEYMGDVIGDLNSRRGQVVGNGHPQRRRDRHGGGAMFRFHDVRLCHRPAQQELRAARPTEWSPATS